MGPPVDRSKTAQHAETPIDVHLILFYEAVSVRTYSPKASEIDRSWFVVDATDLVLGRMSTEVASILRGKHKPIFTPHLDTGDHVIIVNADKVVLTNGKADKKMVYRHSGYPGGLKEETYGNLLARKPGDAIRKTIKGMLPSNRLGHQMLTKLKVYPGPDHPHAAQLPQPLVLDQARADR
jgi:large subunit ribosomal protein L13